VSRPVSPPPLRGFGVTGWIAAAILAALFAAVAMGVDIRLLYLRVVLAILGPEGLMQWTARVHVWHGLALYYPQYDLISLLYVLPAFHIAGVRARWSWIFVIWALVRPPIWHFALPVANAIAHAIAGTNAHGLVGIDAYMMLFDIGTLVLIAGATRSRVVTLAFLVLTLGGGIAASIIENTSYTWVMITGIPYHLLMAAVMIWWAMKIRRRAVLRALAHVCSKCGYDVTGAKHERCPECGAQLAASI
jgi:hypothetical protein